jgi:hypothetical protein
VISTDKSTLNKKIVLQAVAEGSCHQIEHVDPVLEFFEGSPVRGLFCVNLLMLLNVVSTGIEVGNPLTHQLMNPVCEKLSELRVEHCAAAGGTSSSDLNLW